MQDIITKMKTKIGWMNINDIILPLRFVLFGVNQDKIQERIDYYNKFGHMDKPVQIKGNRLCVDGYSRLVDSQWLGLNKVFVEYI